MLSPASTTRDVKRHAHRRHEIFVNSRNAFVQLHYFASLTCLLGPASADVFTRRFSGRLWPPAFIGADWSILACPSPTHCSSSAGPARAGAQRKNDYHDERHEQHHLLLRGIGSSASSSSGTELRVPSGLA